MIQQQQHGDERMRIATGILVWVTLTLAVTASAQEAFGPQAAPAAAHSFSVGTLKVTALRDAQFVAANDGKTFGVDAGPAAVSEVLRAAHAPTDRITLSVNVLLVPIGQRVLLLDSGLGPKLHGGLLASLRQAGVSPDAVTDILITHTHPDHVGGLLDANGALAFPKATIRMANAEWAWLQQQGSAELVKAISAHVQAFEPGAELAPGVKSLAIKGHTPGHVGYEIVSGQARLLDIGDLAHSSIVSLAKPSWTVAFDSDAAAAKSTRMTMLSQLAKDHELVFAPHFPYPGVGHVVMAGDAFAWQAAAH